MCSVVACGSQRRNAKRFKLPEDPDRRLEWVQFLLEANEQQLRESRWTNMRICRQHFTDDCFESPGLTLKSDAVPSLWVKSEPEDPKLCQVKDEDDDVIILLSEPQCRVARATVSTKEKIEIPGSSSPSDKLKYGDRSPSHSEESKAASSAPQESPAPTDPLQNKKRRKSKVKAKIPAAAGCTEVTVFVEQLLDNSDVSRNDADNDVEWDPMEESEVSDGPGDVDSGDDWEPTDDVLLEDELRSDESDEESKTDIEELDAKTNSKPTQLCIDCGKFYRRTPHTCEYKIKPFSCNICGKRCVTQTSLNIHSRIHKDKYKHPCKYCHVIFQTRVDKTTHELTHQGEKKPYKCQNADCPETFKTNQGRRNHHKTHNQSALGKFVCSICGIDFNKGNVLERHMLVHTGEKPFKCSVCQRGFNQAGHLKSHMRVHTEERPYKCQRCDKCFTHNVSLMSHIQRYHSSNSGQKGQKSEENTTVAQSEGDEKGADSVHGNVEEEREVQEKSGQKKQKKYKQSSGRPKGRPKRNAAGNLVLTEENQEQHANIANIRKQKVKKTHSRTEDSAHKMAKPNSIKRVSDCDVKVKGKKRKSKKVNDTTKKKKRF